MRSAQRADDVAGIEWATVGVLSQAWPKNEAAIEKEATTLSHVTLARLEKEGRDSERVDYRAKLQAAGERDCVVRVSWTGDADVDFDVEEPSGSICSLSDPRTVFRRRQSGRRLFNRSRQLSPVLQRGIRLSARIRRHLSRADPSRLGRGRGRQGDRRRVSPSWYRPCGT